LRNGKEDEYHAMIVQQQEILRERDAHERIVASNRKILLQNEMKQKLQLQQ
jgi:hypothetical protein